MSQPSPSLPIKPFSIRVEEEVLSDLRARIRTTRWPDPVPGVAWQQGTDLNYLRQVLAYWANEFDWRAQERKLNAFDHFRAELDGVHIHFVHARAPRGRGMPLILTHGWPSTFVELLPLVPFLTHPEAHGIDSPAFDVFIPSLFSYGFSERPARTGVTTRYTAGLWHSLMRGLGYQRYGAQGGDFEAGVATFMALDDPEPWTLFSAVTVVALALFALGFGYFRFVNPASVFGRNTWDDAQVVVHTLETNERKVLIDGGRDARYVPTGHLVYVYGGGLPALGGSPVHHRP